MPIIIIYGIITTIALIYFIRKDFKFTEIDTELKQQNEAIKADNIRLSNEQIQINSQLESSRATLATLNDTYNETKQSLLKTAQSAADQEFEDYRKHLDKEMQSAIDDWVNIVIARKEKVNSINEQIKIEAEALEELKAKQLAYIKAQQREEEKRSNEDYYRLVISDNDKNEIQLLRNVQLQFLHKDAIDKLIWEVYYKPAFDILSSHIYDDATKICGIYKITDLISGQAYIGQSVDCRERAKQHIRAGLACTRATNKLYQQMQDDKVENFTFEVLERVPREKLNEREKYWINFYQTDIFGLNKTAGGS